MKCIGARTSFFHHSPQHQRPSKWLTGSIPTRFSHHRRQQLIPSQKQKTAMAVRSSLTVVLAEVTLPPAKGDINVFFRTGGLMLVAYLIINFVVPSLISKQLQLDDPAEKEPENKRKQSIMEETLNKEAKKQRGYNSTRPKG